MSAFEATDPAKAAERAHLDQAMQDYLASGKPIEVLPRGAMAELGWTAKQRCNPNVATAARREEAKREREARTVARKAEPLPRFVRERAEPKLAKPKPPKDPARKVRVRAPSPDPRKGTRTAAHRRAAAGKPRGKVPHKSNAILALLQEKGPMRAREIAAALGEHPQLTGQRLWVMRERGRIKSAGSPGNMRWSAKA